MRSIRRLIIIIGFVYLILWLQKKLSGDEARDENSFLEIPSFKIPDQDTRQKETIARTSISSSKVEKQTKPVSEEQERQDLTEISGIGPKTAKVLQDANVLTFQKLATMDPVEVRSILIRSGLRSNQVEKWQKEAKNLAGI